MIDILYVCSHIIKANLLWMSMWNMRETIDINVEIPWISKLILRFDIQDICRTIHGGFDIHKYVYILSLWKILPQRCFFSNHTFEYSSTRQNLDSIPIWGWKMSVTLYADASNVLHIIQFPSIAQAQFLDKPSRWKRKNLFCVFWSGTYPV